MKQLLITIAAVLLVETVFAGPIHDAAMNGDLTGIQSELDKGVDVNAKNINGWTPLHLAAINGHNELAELLIFKDADVNEKDEWGWTPLHYTANFGYKEIAELLIAKGASVNSHDKGKSTALHTAAYWGQKNIAELLIGKGADVNAKNGDGDTPLDWAEAAWENNSPDVEAARKEIADLLRKHEAKTAEELKALMPRLAQHGRFAFTFDTTKGEVYEVQDSFDLLNWEVIKVYTGTGDSVRFDEERDHDPPQWFYRVRVVE